MFETLSLKLELEDNIEPLVSVLPYGEDVPWRDIIVGVKVRHPWSMAAGSFTPLTRCFARLDSTACS